MLNRLRFLPMEVQQKWHGALFSAPMDEEVGNWRLVSVRKTNPVGYQGGKVIVQLLDENERAIPNVDVVFAYDTGKRVYLQLGIDDEVVPEWRWGPPAIGLRGDVVTTGGDGMAEHVQGGVVKDDEPGGITVWIKDPQRPGDYVTGMGMLHDHTGILLTFQKQDVGVVSDAERMASIEANMKVLEDALAELALRVADLEERPQSFELKATKVNYETKD